MSETYDCLLVLALPADLEEEVLDHLSARPHWVSGFSVLHAEGLGSGARLRTSMEQVRGRSRRRLVELLIHREHLEALLESLRGEFKTSEMAWWTVAVTGFGRFT